MRDDKDAREQRGRAVICSEQHHLGQACGSVNADRRSTSALLLDLFVRPSGPPITNAVSCRSSVEIARRQIVAFLIHCHHRKFLGGLNFPLLMESRST